MPTDFTYTVPVVFNPLSLILFGLALLGAIGVIYFTHRWNRHNGPLINAYFSGSFGVAFLVVGLLFATHTPDLESIRTDAYLEHGMEFVTEESHLLSADTLLVLNADGSAADCSEVPVSGPKRMFRVICAAPVSQ